jgi:hypothetical protein
MKTSGFVVLESGYLGARKGATRKNTLVGSDRKDFDIPIKRPLYVGSSKFTHHGDQAINFISIVAFSYQSCARKFLSKVLHIVSTNTVGEQ